MTVSLARAGVLLGIALAAAALWSTTRAYGAWPDDSIQAARHALVAAGTLTLAAVVATSALRGRALAQSLRRRPRLGRALVLAAASLFALALAEGALRLAPAARVDVGALPREPFVAPDPVLGYRPVRDRAVDVELRRSGDGVTLATVRYGFDRDGWRRTVLPRDHDHTRQVWIAGCSHTFGHGLDDQDTVASRYAKVMPDDHVTNLAVPGWGPHHLLALLDVGALPTAPGTTDTPVVAFLWIDHHLDRLCGSMRVRNTYGVDAPCFDIDDDGVAAYRGPFRSAEPWRTAWLWLLGRSELVRRSGYDWPGGHREGDLDRAAAIFRGAALRLRKRHGGRLLIVQFPGEETGAALMTRLRGTDVAYRDLHGIFSQQDPAMRLDEDGHPTAAAARRLGEAIAAAMRETFGR